MHRLIHFVCHGCGKLQPFSRRLAWLGLLAWTLNAAAQDTETRTLGPTKKILIVFSENRDLTGNAMMEQAMRAEMANACTNGLDFYVENFDANRFLDAEHARAFREFLRQKYAGRGLDLVVAFMARDFNLTNELPEEVFSKIPVIFVAVSELGIPDTLRRRGFTGIFQRHDVSGTLSLMFRLQPEIHRVVVVGGVTMTDHLLMSRITTAAQNLDGVEFEFWTNRPLAQMAEGLTNLPPGTAILLGTIQRDVANQPYYSQEVARQILPTASAPVYALSAGLIGTGVVGGAVVDNESLGTQAGELAVLRLYGSTNQFPVEVRTVGTPMVDWRALQRWGISQSRLPGGCLVKYKPPASIWQDHKGVILATAGVLIAQAITIAGLLINRRYRQLAEARARVNQEARALVAAIVESSDDAIIRKDLDGNIMTWNRSAERLFGYASFEAIGKSIDLIVPAARLNEALQIRERARLGEPIHSFETERLHKNGTIIQVSIAISPIFDQSGQVVGASQTCRDITSLKAAEMEIRQQREELAHVTRVSTLGQLTSAITHELNQPLGAILRNAEAAEMFLQSDQPDLNEVRAILADIRKDDQRAGNVIARMRSLLKRRSLVADPLNVREVIEDTVALVRPDLLTRQVKLTVEIPDRVPTLLGDRVHLQQVLLNLLLNGMDAMNAIPSEERELNVRVLVMDGTQLEVSVGDHGTGLPPNESGRLFEAFFTTKPNGMGMGLAISRTIVEAHGGKIRAENNSRRGATFTLSLPVTGVAA